MLTSSVDVYIVYQATIQKLYAGKRKKEKQDKHYVVMTKSGKSFSTGKRKANTKLKVVDKRMKKEIRSLGVKGKGKQKRKGGKSGKGGKGGGKKRWRMRARADYKYTVFIN